METNSIFLKRLKWIFPLIILIIAGCTGPKDQTADTDDEFSFVFMTDIHLQPENNATEGFKLAIDSINKLKPDFVITGGDLIMDALGANYGRADSLYQLYIETIKNVEAPVYNTLGNHEVFAWYSASGADTLHPEKGKTMFRNRIGETYYSFDHKGWHFLILDSVEEAEGEGYIGEINEQQMEWIKKDLSKLGTDVPICVSVHIPVFTMLMQFFYGSREPNGQGLVIDNSKELLDLFEEHNLKLVLQGHTHFLEDIYIGGIHFITSGAVSGHWWRGPHNDCEEGFMLLKVKGDDFEWEYVDYGWDI
jgi:3',5'-cyclic AMP phosphodiesterase CpdA